MGRASHGPIATTSGGPTRAMRKGGPDWYNPDIYGAGWIPLMRKLDQQMKTQKTGPYAEQEKLKIDPAPTGTNTGTKSGGETTTMQDLQIDPDRPQKERPSQNETVVDEVRDQKGGGGATKPPPKKKKPPKKEAGNPSDTSGGGSSAGDANL